MCWEHVLIDHKKLNFKASDSVIVKLFDENERKKIIDEIVYSVFFNVFYNKVKNEFIG